MRRHSFTAGLLGVLVAAVATACGGSTPGPSGPGSKPASSASATDHASQPTSTAIHPFLGRTLWVDPQSKAAIAAQTETALAPAELELVRRIAATPTAFWLTPERLPIDTVAATVSDTIAAAGSDLPVFVVYGIPDRDCTGGHSAGGLDPSGYLEWVRTISGALSQSPVVILEPDALASAERCGLQQQREELLSAAIGLLAPHAAIYVDAGHSDWIPAETMSAMLSVIGIDRVRGFAVNVSSYGADDDERAYAEAIRATLPRAHYVIDSSRNGAGSNGEWCNPEGRALGAVPGALSDHGGLDARLWIKPPGESDGTCGGGPDAGVFWPERAIDLAQNAGW